MATLLQESGFAADRCRFDGEGVLIPDEEAIARIEEHVSADTQALVGVGSGVINDLCKEIAYKSGWITEAQLLESAEHYGKSPYGEHLRNVASDKIYYK